MIYTIGHTESYERYFKEQEADEGYPKKIGRNTEYPGGSVWKTFDNALRHCPNGYSVYGVLANWEKDTKPSNEGDWHDLLVDSTLVKL